MANRPPKICGAPGCGKLSYDGWYCPVHKERLKESKRAHDKTRGNSAARGYDGNWRKIRGRFLLLFPFCMAERNGRECWWLTTQVHHKIPIADGGGNEFLNLRALCESCHSRITGVEKKRGNRNGRKP